MRPSRTRLYLDMARLIAQRSTCARRKVGCVLVDRDGFVLSMGYNGVAATRPHCNEGHPCPGATAKSGESLDLCQAIHAEQNAILRLPDPRQVQIAYCTTSPCISCVKLLLGTSCEMIIYEEFYPHPQAQDWWTEGGREWFDGSKVS